MAIGPGPSAVVSSTLALLVFGIMQLFKTYLASTQMMTLLGGFIGSWFFVFSITAVSNFEMALFGKEFQTKLMPEVIVCLLVSCFVSGLVHRVCITVCFLCSLLALYTINKMSQRLYAAPVATAVTGKRRR